MKKIFSLLFCLLFVFTALVGCRKEEPIPEPTVEELPFVEYNGFRMLNITRGTKGATAYANAIQTVYSVDRSVPQERTLELFGETLSLRYVETASVPGHPYRYNRYEILDKKFPDVSPYAEIGCLVWLCEDSDRIDTLALPISFEISEQATDEELRKVAEELLSPYFDFEDYNKFECDGRGSYNDRIFMRWYRTYEGYVVEDGISVTVVGSDIFQIGKGVAVTNLETIKLPSEEELSSAILSFLNGMYENDGEVKEFNLPLEKTITVFDGQFALEIPVGVTWIEADGSLGHAELIDILIVLD